jgi:hypothetical protein
VGFKLLAALTLCCVPSAMPAAALAQAGPEACAVIEVDSERLACYDAIFAHTGDIDGTEVVVTSERMIPAAPAGRDFARMTVSCVGGRQQVSFVFAGQQVSSTSDIAPVTFQLDQNGTQVRTLAADATNTRLSFGAGSESETFLNGLVAGRNLKVRMTPVRQRSLTVDFRLPEVADEIEALRAACR